MYISATDLPSIWQKLIYEEKSNNLQYNTMVRWFTGTKHLMFQALYFYNFSQTLYFYFQIFQITNPLYEKNE